MPHYANARKTPADIDLGNRIRVCRNRLKKSQEHLAAGLNLTFQQIQKYESGENRVPAWRIPIIASILQVDITDLLHPIDGVKTIPLPFLEMSKTEFCIFELLSMFDRDKKTAVLRICQAISDAATGSNGDHHEI